MIVIRGPFFLFQRALQNRFTGWVDSNLAEKGVAEAHHAAALLQEGGFTFDRVCVIPRSDASNAQKPVLSHVCVCSYSSLLTRAIRTANIVLEDMGLLWLPFHKTWRLNERMCVCVASAHRLV